MLAWTFRKRQGGIDIVAQNGYCLVFVEVKDGHGDPNPKDSVTLKK